MTKQILVGGVPIGGGAPVVIQSMLNTKTTDVEGSLKQIRQLASAGCQIARLAVPNMEAARSFADICKDSPLPLVADIHFDYRLAIAAAEGGASKIRINPGNIGGEDRVKAVVEVCKDKHIPIRIGVNGGSLDKRLLEKYGHPTAEALVESAFEHLELLEKQGFDSYGGRLAVITNGFHMARVGLLWDLPTELVQVPAKLPWWLDANYYLRESFAIVNDMVLRPLLA